MHRALKQIRDLRQEPVSPCKDFWRALRIGSAIAVIIAVVMAVGSYIAH